MCSSASGSASRRRGGSSSSWCSRSTTATERWVAACVLWGGALACGRACKTSGELHNRNLKSPNSNPNSTTNRNHQTPDPDPNATKNPQGVANRDIKLDNLLLQPLQGLPRPLLKVCDFGYSKQDDRACVISKVGTLDYMAPGAGCRELLSPLRRAAG
jgi:hypothetical protein